MCLAKTRANLAQMLFVCDGPKTPRKLRLYGRHALSWLIDEEDARPVSYYDTRRAKHPLLPTPEVVVRHLATAGVRVFCEVDHGKGFLLDGDGAEFPASELRQVIRGLGVPVIADPRPGRNWPYIRGDKVILKMNHDQLNAVVGRPAGVEWVIPAGDAFYEADQRRHFDAVRGEIVAGRLIHCDYLWLTYGVAGMSIGPLNGEWSLHVPAYLGGPVPVDEIRIDPTGCGDTCTAVMANVVAARGYTAAAVVDGFLYANYAAGLAARHLGCHVMTRQVFEEVKREVAEDRVRFLANVV
jgi:bifunctional ADP-heptose synthase (sugar kinase/adenylyltransferase)